MDRRCYRFHSYALKRPWGDLMLSGFSDMDQHQQGPSIRDVLTRQDVHRSSLLWDAPLADERVPGVLTCRRREKGLFEAGLDPRIAAYIKDAGLDGLLRVPNIDVDHALITALVERWRPETHSFHLPHGEMTITLQDMEASVKMVDVEFRGSAHRIKKCACDLLSIGGNLVDDDDSWDLMGNYLRLKSTFLYCDFNRMISSAPRDQKKPLTELANKLFCSIETLINLYMFALVVYTPTSLDVFTLAVNGFY
ncbi:hypothetical protein SO802_033289 [Lithocarpus litseifolius]|uniref:Aminotransferase-like plant mobile domain-containing protein n=1 Tax=Lithocarpus litseifolius TaxID=425828 RepID=A0AAW2BG30_9ROSI